jgi:hypothetical protein
MNKNKKKKKIIDTITKKIWNHQVLRGEVVLLSKKLNV